MKFKHRILFILFAVTVFFLRSDFLPAQTLKDPSSFYEYEKGDIPLIIEAPHGGTMEVIGLTKRLKGNSARDSGTAELAKALAEKIRAKTGKKPYILINKLKRVYSDMNHNTEENEAPEQTEYYDAYHTAIEEASKEVVAKFGQGLLLDLHSGRDKFEQDVYFGTGSGTTIRYLTKNFGKEAFSGEFSIQNQLYLKGYSIPGFNGTPTHPGWTGRVVGHFRDKASRIDGIEFEIKAEKLLKNSESIDKFAEDLADAILVFLNRYYITDSKTTRSE